MNNDNNRIFKEVIIKKSNKNDEKLGISLDSHSHPSFGTFIFISRIDTGSIAHKDGNLLVGDQILKVNEKIIHCLKDIENQIFSSTDKIVFLIARIIDGVDEIDLNLIQNNFIKNNENNCKIKKESKLFTNTDFKSNNIIFNQSSSNKINNPCDMNSKNFNNNNLENELALLRMEMETIRLECDRLLNKDSSSKQMTEIKKSPNSSSLPWRQHFQKNINQQQFIKNLDYSIINTSQMIPRLQEETSSAYNSGGDSCRSTPLIGIPITPPIGYQQNQHLNQQFSLKTEPSQTYVRQPTVTITNIPETNKQKNNSSTCYKLGQTCYTSKDKLAETLTQQQEAVKEMIKNSNFKKVETTKNDKIYGNSIKSSKKSDNDNNKEYTWKLKRRSDGSCYITKKLVKQKILKAREEQLNRERTGLSTDDDAASEIKFGRFWTREERKKQLEKAREKKADKVQKLKNVSSIKDQMIIQLSNKKQMKKSGRQLFDNFTTLQEFLTHGSRDPSAASIGGILSVTTV